MKIILALIAFTQMTAAHATEALDYKIQDTQCTGHLQKDGTVIYKGKCKDPLKKGMVVKSIDGQNVDTPEKAMKLYNEAMKHDATTITVDKNPDVDQD